ncbi:unnamed protein product [Musa acuminata var. zebrina]
MTRSTAQLTTLLLLAALAVASAKPRSARRSLNEAAAACEFVTVPQLCTSLAAKSGATTVPALTVAAVNEAAATAQEAKVTVERITAAPITDAKLKANLDVCWKSYVDSLDTLQKAGSNLQTGAPHNELVSHISAAITYVGHCNDAFSQNPGLVSPVADVTSILKKLISNSLALAMSHGSFMTCHNLTSDCFSLRCHNLTSDRFVNIVFNLSYSYILKIHFFLDRHGYVKSNPNEHCKEFEAGHSEVDRKKGHIRIPRLRIRIKPRPQAWVMFVRALRYRRRRRRIRMAADTRCRPILIPSAVSLVVLLLLAATAPAFSSSEGRTLLERLNKPSVKTVQVHLTYLLLVSEPGWRSHRLRSLASPTGFRSPHAERIKAFGTCYTGDGMADDFVQLWTTSGETCPEGTVPIRRTKEEDILRIERFGRKPFARAPQSTNVSNHEYAIGHIEGEQYYGAHALFNVWAPQVANRGEFSLSQLWIISGNFDKDLNTVETGWQVYPELYGDTLPRFFVYWTNDSYQNTGCYNLYCSGFVQTNNSVAVGVAITRTSTYNDTNLQYVIRITVSKDQKTGNWWLQLGSTVVGYWPSFLFSNLASSATMVEFGGEIVNTRPSGLHTDTQMGSGHFAEEGFGRAAFVSSIRVVDSTYTLIPARNLSYYTDDPNCYDVQGGVDNSGESIFYFGGPGRNDRCP